MSIVRVPRESKTHDIDLTVPVNSKEIMQTDKDVHGASCFSRLWDMTTEACSMCADNEMCGIMFHKRQTKLVKEMEQQMPATLDTADFEGINKEELLLWLKIKPRRTGELAQKVAQLSGCTEVETVRFWTKSFIKTHDRLSIKGNIVIVAPKN